MLLWSKAVVGVLNLDPTKLVVIAFVAIVLLGPDRLPQVARQVGGAWRAVSEFRQRMETEVRSSIPDLPSGADLVRLARSPSALLDELSRRPADPGEDTDPVTPPTMSRFAPPRPDPVDTGDPDLN
ncbi:MAG: twin-arginine translocase TatA/TatE family subunit [Acidimicrobiales bacterium]